MASALPLIGGKVGSHVNLYLYGGEVLTDAQVVPDSSSRLDDGVGNTSNIAANHRDMCKFVSPTSRDYLRVISVIKRFSTSTMTDSTSLVAASAQGMS